MKDYGITILKNDFENAFTVIDTNTSYYSQHSNFPFVLSIMSNHPDSAGENVISVFTPESQVNSSYADTDSKDSQRPLHQHNYFEMMYILKGHMFQIVEGKRYLYSAGSCCILNRNTMHTEETCTEFVAVFFSLSVDFLKKILSDDTELLFRKEKMLSQHFIYPFLQDNLDSVHSNIRDFLDFVPNISESEQKVLVHDLFEKIIFTMISPFWGATFQIQSLFFQILSILCDSKYYHAKHVTTNSNSTAMTLARIDQLLEEYNGRISNHDLAKILNYSGTYLSRIVKKAYGVSLFEYSMKFTMKEASRLLLYTKKSVSEIALELKFSNRTHFYKIFQEYYQSTPLEYRKSVLTLD